MNIMDGFSVIMPTYNQCSFIRRAISSLFSQTYSNWELIIINDGCTDETESFISDFLSDSKITYIKNQRNEGLGYAINQGLDIAKYNYIAYLPSDDFYYENHLELFKDKFEGYSKLVLVFSGFKCDIGDTMVNANSSEFKGLKPNYSLQLVQVCHRKTQDRWVEREEWVSENLFDLFWNKLIDKGSFISTKKVSCFWTNHPHQRHKIMGERYGGGLNQYRAFYKVKEPIKMKTSKYKFINEEELYASFREKVKIKSGSLKILLVGELAYNPERIYALEQAGHKLYGLWITKPGFTFSTIGPLPFGNIEDIPYDDWRESIEKIKPDIIYALLNHYAVNLAYEVLKEKPDIPFVWHFKEGPSMCLKSGYWDKLIYLYTYADGKIYLNETMQSWFEQFIPQTGSNFILDGDIPKKDYFHNNFSKKISGSDGAIHTIIAGRAIGIGYDEMKFLTNQNIHIHSYSENYHSQKNGFNQTMKKIAPDHFHVHSHCNHSSWVEEFSKYDAGWLHCLRSHNQENLLLASWDDLNIPARINTYAAAGLPVILKNNEKHTVAIQSMTKQLEIGIFFNDMQDLTNQLKDQQKMKKLTQNALQSRDLFTFDYHVDRLIDFFKKVIEKKNKKDEKKYC